MTTALLLLMLSAQGGELQRGPGLIPAPVQDRAVIALPSRTRARSACATGLARHVLPCGHVTDPKDTTQNASGDHFERGLYLLRDISIATAGATAMVDLAITEHGIGAGTLRELNPLLRRYEQAPIKMGAAKAALTVGQVYVLLKLRKKHPAWTFITASVISALNTWAIVHNQREAEK